MIHRALVLGVLAAVGLLTLMAVSSAAPSAKKQRAAITGSANSGSSPETASWKFSALNSGPIRSTGGGSVKIVDLSEKRGVADGQSYAAFRSRWTFTFKNGTLVLLTKERHVSAGALRVLTSTWRVLRGTGSYKGVTGRGRAAGAWPSVGIKPGLRSIRFEGILTSP